MATQYIDLWNGSVAPDVGGSVYQSTLGAQLTLANTEVGAALCFVFPDNSGSTDEGINGNIRLPADYSSTPVVEFQGVLKGAPGGSNIAFGFEAIGIADGEVFDAAFEDPDLVASASSDADEDVYSDSITPSITIAANDLLSWRFFMDDSAYTASGQLLLTSIRLKFTDTA
jgi:hypothetical protein